MGVGWYLLWGMESTVSYGLDHSLLKPLWHCLLSLEPKTASRWEKSIADIHLT